MQGDKCESISEEEEQNVLVNLRKVQRFQSTKGFTRLPIFTFYDDTVFYVDFMIDQCLFVFSTSQRDAQQHKSKLL